MEKTILKLSKNISLIILSCVMILFSLVNNYQQINNSISLVFILTKCALFIAIPFSLYNMEKENFEFKKVAGIYASYSIINLIVTIIYSFSITGGIAFSFTKMIFDLINLIILLTSLLILIEQFLEYNGIKSKLYSNTIMKFVYYLGNMISYPLLSLINKKFKKKDE